MSLVSLGQLCPGCVHSQPLAHLHPTCWGWAEWEKEKASMLCQHGSAVATTQGCVTHIVLASDLKHSTIWLPWRKLTPSQLDSVQGFRFLVEMLPGQRWGRFKEIKDKLPPVWFLNSASMRQLLLCNASIFFPRCSVSFKNQQFTVNDEWRKQHTKLYFYCDHLTVRNNSFHSSLYNHFLAIHTVQ